MKSNKLFLVLLIIHVWISRHHFINCQDPCFPNQIHLNIGDFYYYYSQYQYLNKSITDQNSTIMNTATIVWQTNPGCGGSYLVLQSNNHSEVYKPNETNIFSQNSVWNDSNDPVCFYNSTSYVVYLSNLNPGSFYTYKIFEKHNGPYSGPFTFKLPNISNSSTSFILFGDIDANALGNQTLENVYALARDNYTKYDGIIQLGDIAYDINTRCGQQGEYFFNAIQKTIAIWPFIMTPGNHELFNNWQFLNFRLRDPLYQTTQNHYFSWNAGYAHYIFFDYDYYYSQDKDNKLKIWNWLTNDLIIANQVRKIWPWIIINSHRPMYCSFNDPNDNFINRCYNFYSKMQQFDELWFQYGVDLMISAHIHAYERMSPVYKNQSIETQSKMNDFENPCATIHIINGDGGNDYFMDDPSISLLIPHKVEGLPYSQYIHSFNSSPSYGVLNIINQTMLTYYQYLSKDSTVIDYMTITKTFESFSSNNKCLIAQKSSSRLYSHTVIVIIIIIIIFIILSTYRYRTRTKSIVYLPSDNNELEITTDHIENKNIIQEKQSIIVQ